MLSPYHELLVADWYQWVERLPCCEIGYPNSYDPKRYGGKRPARSIPPFSIMVVPERLQKVDRVMRILPRRHVSVLAARYRVGGRTERERARNAGFEYETYRLKLRLAHEWLSAKLE